MLDSLLPKHFIEVLEPVILETSADKKLFKYGYLNHELISTAVQPQPPPREKNRTRGYCSKGKYNLTMINLEYYTVNITRDTV